MNANCPHCQQIDRIQKISAIHSLGISHMQASGNIDFFNSFSINGSSQTALSILFTPPPKPPRPRFSISFDIKKISLVSACSLITEILFMILVIPINILPEFFVSLLAWLFFLTVILFFACITVIMLRLFPTVDNTIFSYSGNTHEEHLKSWQQACNIWNKLYYCHRCNIVYDPASPTEIASPEKFRMFFSKYVTDKRIKNWLGALLNL
jgi:hypothetical protein